MTSDKTKGPTMKTTDAQWGEMTAREQDAMVRKALWDYVIESHPHDGETFWREWRDGCWRNIPDLTSTWPGFGLVVERMRELGYGYCVQDREDGKHLAEFCKKDSNDYGEATAACDSAPSAAALAAVRAMEAEK